LHLDPLAFGLWSGSSIHEIAQVVAASFQDGSRAGEIGTIAKLARVMMLAPLVIALAFVAAQRLAHTKGALRSGSTPIPWFVLGFVALMVLNSVVTIPPSVKAGMAATSTFFLAMALAAMGLSTDFRKLKDEGLRPLGLAAASWLFIATLSLCLIKLAGV
jgi:uncharacterized integral membrane protein (TIGR00698 family)